MPINPIRGELGDCVVLQHPRVFNKNNKDPTNNLLGYALRVKNSPMP